MPKQRFRRFDHQLYCEAVQEAFKNGKWYRNDVLSFIEKYAGIPRAEIRITYLTGDAGPKIEAVESIALYLEDVVDGILRGEEPEDMVPVKVRQRRDGMTGKVRDIALLCILHQLLGHVAKLALDPLLHARITHTQHASIPERGQTSLKKQVHKYLRKESLGIRYAEKTDVTHAYATTMYAVLTDLIRKEIPKAKDLLCLLEYLGKIAPGGHLIIGGYIDAWLFNFAMSYAIRFTGTVGQTRRGRFTPFVIRCVAFMDDFLLLGRSAKGLKRATKALDKWMQENLHLSIRVSTGIIRILPVKEEKARRSLEEKAKRGCPVVDMAGFKICRTHIMIRRRVFIRARREFIRAAKELRDTGTLRRSRAFAAISYYSFVAQTDSVLFARKYHVEELVQAAAKIVGFYTRLKDRQRKEILYALQKRRAAYGAGEGTSGEAPRVHTGEAPGQCQAGGEGRFGGNCPDLPF